MTIAYFALSALDLLNQLDSKVENEERLGYIDWIYDQQLNEAEGGGFAPGPYLPKANTETLSGEATPGSRRQGNLAMTYTAIMSLAILKDDFSRLNKSALYRHLHTLQQNDGRYEHSIHDNHGLMIDTALHLALDRKNVTVALCFAPLPYAMYSTHGPPSMLRRR